MGEVRGVGLFVLRWCFVVRLEKKRKKLRKQKKIKKLSKKNEKNSATQQHSHTYVGSKESSVPDAAGHTVIPQADGNLVILAEDGKPVWAS